MAKIYIKNGYKRYSNSNTLVHRHVAEQMLGRPLKGGEVVHHKDRDKTNNSRDNLHVFPNQAAHDKVHKLDAKRHGKTASYQGFKKKKSNPLAPSRRRR